MTTLLPAAEGSPSSGLAASLWPDHGNGSDDNTPDLPKLLSNRTASSHGLLLARCGKYGSSAVRVRNPCPEQLGGSS